jgi:hypothetical protein
LFRLPNFVLLLVTPSKLLLLRTRLWPCWSELHSIQIGLNVYYMVIRPALVDSFIALFSCHIKWNETKIKHSLSMQSFIL